MKRSPNHLVGPDGNCSVNCWVCRVKSVSFAPSAMPTRSPDAARTKAGDKALVRDLDAYRAMRHNGMQPKSTKGAADLQARANEPFEISTGQIVDDPDLRRRAQQTFDDMPAPSSTPIVREDADAH